jgi:hypothetical protein
MGVPEIAAAAQRDIEDQVDAAAFAAVAKRQLRVDRYNDTKAKAAYKHYRCGPYGGGVITVAWFIGAEMVAYGLSFCAPGEQFDRKQGCRIALRRLTAAQGGAMQNRNGLDGVKHVAGLWDVMPSHPIVGDAGARRFKHNVDDSLLYLVWQHMVQWHRVPVRSEWSLPRWLRTFWSSTNQHATVYRLQDWSGIDHVAEHAAVHRAKLEARGKQTDDSGPLFTDAGAAEKQH